MLHVCCLDISLQWVKRHYNKIVRSSSRPRPSYALPPSSFQAVQPCIHQPRPTIGEELTAEIQQVRKGASVLHEILLRAVRVDTFGFDGWLLQDSGPWWADEIGDRCVSNV